MYLRASSSTWCDPCKGATEACKGCKRQQGCTALPAPLGGRHWYPKLLPPSPCPRACGDAERQHKILAGSPCMASPLLNAGQAAAGSCRRAKGRAGLPSGSTDLPRAEIALHHSVLASLSSFLLSNQEEQQTLAWAGKNGILLPFRVWSEY